MSERPGEDHPDYAEDVPEDLPEEFDGDEEIEPDDSMDPGPGGHHGTEQGGQDTSGRSLRQAQEET